MDGDEGRGRVHEKQKKNKSRRPSSSPRRTAQPLRRSVDRGRSKAANTPAAARGTTSSRGRSKDKERMKDRPRSRSRGGHNEKEYHRDKQGNAGQPKKEPGAEVRVRMSGEDRREGSRDTKYRHTSDNARGRASGRGRSKEKEWPSGRRTPDREREHKERKHHWDKKEDGKKKEENVSREHERGGAYSKGWWKEKNAEWTHGNCDKVREHVNEPAPSQSRRAPDIATERGGRKGQEEELPQGANHSRNSGLEMSEKFWQSRRMDYQRSRSRDERQSPSALEGQRRRPPPPPPPPVAVQGYRKDRQSPRPARAERSPSRSQRQVDCKPPPSSTAQEESWQEATTPKGSKFRFTMRDGVMDKVEMMSEALPLWKEGKLPTGRKYWQQLGSSIITYDPPPGNQIAKVNAALPRTGSERRRVNDKIEELTLEEGRAMIKEATEWICMGDQWHDLGKEDSKETEPRIAATVASKQFKNRMLALSEQMKPAKAQQSEPKRVEERSRTQTANLSYESIIARDADELSKWIKDFEEFIRTHRLSRHPRVRKRIGIQQCAGWGTTCARIRGRWRRCPTIRRPPQREPVGTRVQGVFQRGVKRQDHYRVQQKHSVCAGEGRFRANHGTGHMHICWPISAGPCASMPHRRREGERPGRANAKESMERAKAPMSTK